ncbi:hypothetical protein KEJ27_09710, partial [Candidatus Bathyarchaeota archaeon]|nr:hypothetical protein [Candidatus Bathyarchaeota archaeon]
LALYNPQINKEKGNSYVPELYSIAERNKIPLMYLNTINPQERQKLSEYNYHYTRLQRLVDLMTEISRLFSKEGINYVIFKTLRPYPEDVSDIDVLNMGSHSDYKKMVELLRGSNYLFMEKCAYCTTFQDYKTRFRTEVMIDLYDEISISHLIYLDKRKLSNCIMEKLLPGGFMVRVFAPEAELLVTIAHSAIKENMYILAEYYVTLHYLALMDQTSIENFIGLIKKNKLVKACRWHLTITSILHKLAHGFVPEKLSNLLLRLDRSWSRAYKQILESDYPPYKCDPATLASIFKEKLQDNAFRRSLCAQMFMPLTKTFTTRLLTKLENILH